MTFASKLLFAASLFAFAQAPSYASLLTFRQFVGPVGYSSDGFGDTSNRGTISASVPVGSTVLAAYLYSASYFNPDGGGVAGSLNGTSWGAGTFLYNPAVGGDLGATRYDVTSIVAPVINGGAGGVYNFTITESSVNQDGEALIVIYSNPTFSTRTVALLDGFSAAGGDVFTARFGISLDPSQPGFLAEMILGIGFSCCNQRSTVSVNGTVISNNAGNHDDGAQELNGSLITVGGFDDPYSSPLPSYADDHERYNLAPYIQIGDTSINVRTNNPSNDDNIFLAVLNLSGEADVQNVLAVPEPAAYLTLGLGLTLLALWRRR